MLAWDELVAAARSIGWVAYVGTADAGGQPHVAAVAPGFTDGSIWFATNRSSKKLRNLTANDAVAFHWPVTSGGEGELAAWGRATLYDGADATSRIWSQGIFDYDLAQFFGSPDNDQLVFVEVRVERARLMGPDFVARRYRL